MVAGGSGITPMFQVAAAILGNPWDATKIFLVYANVAEGDILLREQLDKWARTEKARFKVRAVSLALAFVHTCSSIARALATFLLPPVAMR